MYIPKHFREESPEALHSLIEKHPLATILVPSAQGIEANLLPLELCLAGDLRVLRGHLARANPLAKLLKSKTEVLVLFYGPQSYISPSFYAEKAQSGRAVPTWNYSVVEIRGSAVLIDDKKWLMKELRSLTQRNELNREEPWSVEDAPSDYIESLVNAIVGIEISIDQINGKFKMSQNQPEENRKSVIENFSAENDEEIAIEVRKRAGLRFPIAQTLEGETLQLRRLTAADFDELADCAADPEIWEQHPNKDRYKRDVFQRFFDKAISSESAYAIIDKKSGRMIGSSRFYDHDAANDSIAIGYTFLAKDHWGGGTNRELKSLMLTHAFKNASRVYFHIGESNLRSRKAVEKLGATLCGTQLREGQPYTIYSISRSNYLALNQNGKRAERT